MIEIILAVVLLIIIFHIYRGSSVPTNKYARDYKYKKKYMLDADSVPEPYFPDSDDSDDSSDTHILPMDDMNKNRWATLEQSTSSLIPGSVLSNKICGTDVSGINLDKYVKTKLENYAFGNEITGANSFYDDKFESGVDREGTAFDSDGAIASDINHIDYTDKQYREQYFSFHDKINGSSNEAADPVDKMNAYLFSNNKSGMRIQDVFDGMTSNR